MPTIANGFITIIVINIYHMEMGITISVGRGLASAAFSTVKGAIPEIILIYQGSPVEINLPILLIELNKAYKLLLGINVEVDGIGSGLQPDTIRYLITAGIYTIVPR